MDRDLETLVAEARKLPPEKQVELIGILVDGLQQPGAIWDVAWSEEAARRWRMLQSGEMKSYPADDVLADISRRLARRRTA